MAQSEQVRDSKTFPTLAALLKEQLALQNRILAAIEAQSELFEIKSNILCTEQGYIPALDFDNLSPKTCLNHDAAAENAVLQWRNSLIVDRVKLAKIRIRLASALNNLACIRKYAQAEQRKAARDEIISQLESVKFTKHIFYDPAAMFAISPETFGRLMTRYYISNDAGNVELYKPEKRPRPEHTPMSVHILSLPLRGIYSIFKPQQGFLPLKILLLLICHVGGSISPVDDDLDDTENWIITYEFLCCFSEPWKLNGQRHSSYFYGQPRSPTNISSATQHSRHVVIWFAMRYYTIAGYPPYSQKDILGIECMREQTILPDSQDGNGTDVYSKSATLPIREIRDCLLLKLVPNGDATTYSIVVLTDNVSAPKPETIENNMEMSASQRCCPILTPLQMFCIFIREHFKRGIEQWATALAQMEEDIELKLSHIADNNFMTRIMYDSIHMDGSKYYFKILQFLRIMHDSVDDLDARLAYWSTKLQDVLEKLRGPCGFSQNSSQKLLETWQELESCNRNELHQLRERIERKQREIESLRDGLFNATSVREALQAGRTNQNIMVFTVVTIAYLPLTFVTSLFSMNNVHDNDQWLYDSLIPWAIVLCIVAMSTYLFAGFGTGWYKKYKAQKEVHLGTSKIRFSKDYRLFTWRPKSQSDLETGQQPNKV